MAENDPKVKGPGERLDFPNDWGSTAQQADRRWLDTDEVITVSTWVVDETLAAGDDFAIDAEAQTGKTTTVWLVGGLIGETYELKNTITTSDNRIATRKRRVTIVDR